MELLTNSARLRMSGSLLLDVTQFSELTRGRISENSTRRKSKSHTFANFLNFTKISMHSILSFSGGKSQSHLTHSGLRPEILFFVYTALSIRYIPLDLRPKKTRALRRQLTAHEASIKTKRQQKKDAHFSQRVFAIKA